MGINNFNISYFEPPTNRQLLFGTCFTMKESLSTFI